MNMTQLRKDPSIKILKKKPCGVWEDSLTKKIVPKDPNCEENSNLLEIGEKKQWETELHPTIPFKETTKILSFIIQSACLYQLVFD